MRIFLNILFLTVASWLCWETHHVFSGHGSGFLYLGWCGTLTLVGFFSAAMWPRCAVWGALFVTLSQSLFLYWDLHAAGEIEQPSRSTGGMVTWGIVTFFLLMFSPVPAAASWYGRRWRCKPAQRAPAADGASRRG